MSTRKQLSGAQKRALQQQAALKAKRMKGSMEQYLVKNQDAIAVDIDQNAGESEKNGSSTTTKKDCASDFKNNGTNFNLRVENSDFIDREWILNMTDDEENDCSLENMNNEMKINLNNELILTMTHDEENSLSLDNNEMNMNNELMLTMTDDEKNSLSLDNNNMNNEIMQNLADEENPRSLDNISNNGMKMNSNNELILNITGDEENSLSLENISNDEIKVTINNDVIESFSPDPGLWPMVITEEMREYFTKNKPCQFILEIHNSARFCYDKTRVLTEHNFYRMKKNKEKIKREWLIYSPVKKAVFCYVCKLFSCSRQSLCDEGFINWKNISERLSEHENSRTHRDSVFKLSSRAEKCKRIDCEIINEYSKKCKYWRSVLSRVVSVIKFLAERGLPLFGDDETIGSLKNGNFLGCLELLAKFDPFISEHLDKHGNPGKGNVNYLSSTIATELLQLMSDKVLKFILSELSESKYYGLILDSTPDISHTDQLSIVLRYVNSKGEPVERFIKFLPISSHNAESLSTTILNELDCLNLDILNCRGQSYDNASNMAGRYSGLQARIKDVSPLAEYVPCAAHSLNLVGINAVQCCNQVISFFGIVQNIYNFFSSSTQRWNSLQEKLKTNNQKLTLKPLSSTRWSAEADATKVLRKGYVIIRQTLLDISENENIASTARHEARSLCSKMNKLETALMTVIWDSILERMNGTNKSFQNDSNDISSVVPMYKSLIKFIQSVRGNFIQYEKEAKDLIDAEVTYVNARKKLFLRD